MRDVSRRAARTLCRGCLLILAVTLMVACSSRPPAPIEDHTRPGAVRADERYTVLRGDTLYSIAFRYGLDFRRLAAANRIAAPYTIYPGQELRLAEAEPPRVVRSSSPSRKSNTKDSSPSKPNTVAKAPATTTSATSRKTPPSTTLPSAASQSPPKSSTGNTAASADLPVSRWQWPASGRVVRRFDANLHKGINIAGDRGDPIKATAGGRVVYAGTGIAGYGLMLILRHNEEYLSAYGHNDALLVSEGDVVRAGQSIARRGSSGTDSPKLHFEIRRRGRPVDPLGLLPTR